MAHILIDGRQFSGDLLLTIQHYKNLSGSVMNIFMERERNEDGDEEMRYLGRGGVDMTTD